MLQHRQFAATWALIAIHYPPEARHQVNPPLARNRIPPLTTRAIHGWPSKGRGVARGTWHAHLPKAYTTGRVHSLQQLVHPFRIKHPRTSDDNRPATRRRRSAAAGGLPGDPYSATSLLKSLVMSNSRHLTAHRHPLGEPSNLRGGNTALNQHAPTQKPLSNIQRRPSLFSDGRVRCSRTAVCAALCVPFESANPAYVFKARISGLRLLQRGSSTSSGRS